MLKFIASLFKNHYESLNGRAFKEKFKSTPQAVLLDVRTPGEFKQESIRGARNINLMSPTFEDTIKSLDKNKTYFVYCRSGGRSGRACNIMGKMGFTAYNLSGGIGSWPN